MCSERVSTTTSWFRGRRCPPHPWPRGSARGWTLRACTPAAPAQTDSDGWCMLESQTWVGSDVVRPDCAVDPTDPFLLGPGQRDGRQCPAEQLVPGLDAVQRLLPTAVQPVSELQLSAGSRLLGVSRGSVAKHPGRVQHHARRHQHARLGRPPGRHHDRKQRDDHVSLGERCPRVDYDQRVPDNDDDYGSGHTNPNAAGIGSQL